MTTIQIQTSLSPAGALACGHLQHGHLLVTPTTEQIAALSPEQRTALARYVAPEREGDRYRWDNTLLVSAPGWAGVLAALAEAEAKAKAKDEAARAAHVARAQLVIATPRAALLYDRSVHDTVNRDVLDCDTRSQYEAALDTARTIAARDREVAAEKVAAEKVAAEKVAAEKVAAEEHAEIIPRAWCAEHGASLSTPLQRSAREGRKVRGELTRLVHARAADAIGALGETAESYNDQPREDVPTEEAYRVLDACTAARDEIAHACLLPGVTVTVGPIARHDIAECGFAVWRTGVEVSVSHPWLTEPLSMVVLAEPLDAEEE